MTLPSPQPSTCKNGREPRICLVVCFWGDLLGWMPLYLMSCQYNPTVDFLILTDNFRFPATPANVRVEMLDATAFNQIATAKLGMPIKISNPYKLCDFKPA